jgi:hypothetical protein
MPSHNGVEFVGCERQAHAVRRRQAQLGIDGVDVTHARTLDPHAA